MFTTKDMDDAVTAFRNMEVMEESGFSGECAEGYGIGYIAGCTVSGSLGKPAMSVKEVHDRYIHTRGYWVREGWNDAVFDLLCNERKRQ